MKNILFILLLLSVTTFTAQAQSDAYNTSVRKVEASSQSQITSLKIDRSQIWVNGKLIPEKELPKALRSLDPSIFYEAAVMGMEELAFNLDEKIFVVKDGKLIEAKPSQNSANKQASIDKSAQESYYSQLKRESPGLFYGISREGVLLERVRTLLIEYASAKERQRPKIKSEIRLVLGQLFEINERNKALEIKELEEMIKMAKDELEYRKANKSKIINNSLENLLRE